MLPAPLATQLRNNNENTSKPWTFSRVVVILREHAVRYAGRTVAGITPRLFTVYEPVSSNARNVYYIAWRISKGPHGCSKPGLGRAAMFRFMVVAEAFLRRAAKNQRPLSCNSTIMSLIIIISFAIRQLQMNPPKHSFDMMILYSYRSECTLNTNQL